MKSCYIDKTFSAERERIIREADEMMVSYAVDGYDLTLRQVYYQFVARDLFPDDRRWTWTGTKWIRDPDGTKNAEPNYKWLGKILNDARLAGRLAWDIMVDRTRELRHVSHWSSPGEILRLCAEQYRIDTRVDQSNYIEVWVEKDALAGIVLAACETLDLDSIICRGFVSQSAMWQAAQRFASHRDQKAVLLYLGDHDPSGIDMVRDIRERLNETFQTAVEVVPIALTMEQVTALGCPPSPAKVTDSRYHAYRSEYGDDSWELDAMEPRDDRSDREGSLQKDKRHPPPEAGENTGATPRAVAGDRGHFRR